MADRVRFRWQSLRRNWPAVQCGEVFPTHIPYEYDERIDQLVGCVYVFTSAWVHMHQYVLYSDQICHIQIDDRPNEGKGLWSKIDSHGKEVLYTDFACNHKWEK